MEQEKLAESKRTFEDDKEGYERYLDQLRADVALIEEEVKDKVKEKMRFKEQIRLLNEEIYDIVSECGKIDDQLEIYKNSRAFIDTLSRFSKAKSNNFAEGRRKSKLTLDTIQVPPANVFIFGPDQINSEQPSSSKFNPRSSIKQDGESFFITNVAQKNEKRRQTISSPKVNEGTSQNPTPVEMEGKLPTQS